MPRWECRYSSSEMLYLEVTATEVRQYLDHGVDRPTRTSFEDVLAGTIDGDIRNLFGPEVVEALKTAVRRQMLGPVEPPAGKDELRRRRRAEGKGL